LLSSSDLFLNARRRKSVNILTGVTRPASAGNKSAPLHPDPFFPERLFMSDYYLLDGYELFYLPGPGGYSGYNPKRRQTQEATLSANYTVHWGLVEEDQILTIGAPYCSREEFLSLQARYQAEEEGNPKRYTFKEPHGCYEVELLDLRGNPYRGLYQNVELEMRVLSAQEWE
jgi:hypothetical protein